MAYEYKIGDKVLYFRKLLMPYLRSNELSILICEIQQRERKKFYLRGHLHKIDIGSMHPEYFCPLTPALEYICNKVGIK